MMLSLQIKGTEIMKQRLQQNKTVAQDAAVMSVNDTIRKGRKLAKDEVLQQINFPRSYLNGAEGNSRLYTVLASKTNLTGSIVGRRRPTSLARFVTRQLKGRGKNGKMKNLGVEVKVRRNGRTSTMKRAFLIALKRGKVDGGNQGLAIRLPKGEEPHRRYHGRPLYKDRRDNVWLLYGPSVQQVLLNNEGKGVFADLQPRLQTYLIKEFTRQYERLSRG